MSLPRSAEYDAFGPWILRVATADDVPRAFCGYPFDFTGTRQVLKIPRDIARRDADPSMHLYDRMLIVSDEGLTVLARDGDAYTETSLSSELLAAVELGGELLDGWLTVHGTDGTRIHIEFNGSSRAMISAVVDLLVPLAGETASETADSAFTPEAPALDALAPSDTAIVNAYLDSARRRGLQLYAAAAGSIPVSREPFLVRALRRRRRLSAAVVCGNERELVVTSRRAWLRASTKPDMSTRELIIRRDRITGLTATGHPILDGVTTASIELGSALIDIVLATKGPALQILRQHATAAPITDPTAI